MSGGTLAVRFRDAQIGKESTTASSCKAVVSNPEIPSPAVVLCHDRAAVSLWDILEARAVVVVSLSRTQSSSQWHTI